MPGSRDHDGAYVGRDGRIYITGSVVGPSDLTAESFDRCPVASMRETWVGEVWQAWRAHEKGGLAAIEPEPSAALIEAIDEVGRGVAAVERRIHDRLKSKREGGPRNG